MSDHKAESDLIIHMDAGDHNILKSQKSARSLLSTGVIASGLNKQLKTQMYIKNMQLQLIAQALTAKNLNLRTLFRIYLEPNDEENYVKAIKFTHFLRFIRELEVFKNEPSSIYEQARAEDDEVLSLLVEEMLE